MQHVAIKSGAFVYCNDMELFPEVSVIPSAEGDLSQGIYLLQKSLRSSMLTTPEHAPRQGCRAYVRG